MWIFWVQNIIVWKHIRWNSARQLNKIRQDNSTSKRERQSTIEYLWQDLIQYLTTIRPVYLITGTKTIRRRKLLFAAALFPRLRRLPISREPRLRWLSVFRIGRFRSVMTRSTRLLLRLRLLFSRRSIAQHKRVFIRRLKVYIFYDLLQSRFIREFHHCIVLHLNLNLLT